MMFGMAKTGRPRLEKRRSEVITAFRCTQEQRGQLERAAKVAGLSLSDWLRDVALRASKSKGRKSKAARKPRTTAPRTVVRRSSSPPLDVELADLPAVVNPISADTERAALAVIAGHEKRTKGA